MSVVYNDTVKNTRLTAVLDAIDAGTAGKLKIYTAGLASLLATFTLADPSGAVAAQVLTFDFDPDIDAVAGATGTAAEATITTSADVVIVSGLTVGTSGTNIILDSVSITSGQTVRMLTGTITHG